MANVLVLTSGKGGVGKTTSTVALDAALAQRGDTVAVVDFDVGLSNLDLVMGAERRVVFDFIDVMHGTAKLSQAPIRDKRLDTLWVLPASQTHDKNALTADGVAKVMEKARRGSDWVLCDSPACIERGASLAMLRRQDRKWRKRRAGREIPVDDPLRPSTCRRRRDTEHRGCARDSRHPSAWSDAGEPRGAPCIEPRRLGPVMQPRKCAGPRLLRRGAPAQGRELADDGTEGGRAIVWQALQRRAA